MIGKSYVNKSNLKLYEVYSLQHCHVLTLCNPMDCSSPSSSVHGIFQATLDWFAISSSKGIFPTQVSNRSSVLAGSFLEYLGASCHIRPEIHESGGWGRGEPDLSYNFTRYMNTNPLPTSLGQTSDSNQLSGHFPSPECHLNQLSWLGRGKRVLACCVNILSSFILKLGFEDVCHWNSFDSKKRTCRY